MAFYDALVTAWNDGATSLPSGASGSLFQAGDTTAKKIAKVNAWTVAGPLIDVPVSAVEGYLSLSGALTAMEDWLGTSPAPGIARTAAKELLRTVASPHVTVFRTSDPATYAALQGMLGALSASPPALLTSDQVAALLAMANGPSMPWVQSNGWGPINADQLAAAGGLT